jgi:hypothetical protein
LVKSSFGIEASQISFKIQNYYHNLLLQSTKFK